MNTRRVLALFSMLVAMVTLSYPTTAPADVFYLDEYAVTRSGTQIFDDSFNRTTTLNEIPPATVPTGQNFSDGTVANYFVRGTIPESTANNGQAQLNTANGILQTQPDPFLPFIKDVSGALQTGTSGGHALTPSNTFSVIGLYDLVVPPTTLGTYAIFLTNRIQANNFLGYSLELRLRNCTPGLGACGALTSPVLQFMWFDFVNNAATPIGQVALTPAELADPQLEFEFVHGSTSSDVIDAYYAFGTGNTLGSFSGSLTLLGSTGPSTDVFAPNLDFVLPGFEAFVPVPEPGSLALLGAGLGALVALGWRRRRS